MGIGLGLVLIAAGAILRWAVNTQVSGIELATVGLILMVVGAVALVMGLIFSGPWSRTRVRRERVEDDHGRGYDRVETSRDTY